MMVPDGVVALWVIACLAAATIAMAQERSAIVWLMVAVLTGPVAPVLLLIKGSPHGSALHARLCNDCFARVSGPGILCGRCEARENRRRGPSRGCH